ncbi:MAG: anthranilate synthase component I [Pseudomonadota bacterium]|nr:anthranilate synthase component I [Pseudomonadota bacterium]
MTKPISLEPSVKKIIADTESPLSVYLKLANKKNTFLLESVEGGEKWGRYSVIGLASTKCVVVRGNEFKILENDIAIKTIQTKDPLKLIEDYKNDFTVKNAENLPRFCGGLVGYFSFDTVRFTEKKLGFKNHKDSLETPDILLLFVDNFVIFDNLKNELTIVKYFKEGDLSAKEDSEKAIAEISLALSQNASPIQTLKTQIENESLESLNVESEFKKEDFKTAVNTIKDYITEGDAMQVVLSQRFCTEFRENPINLYRALRHLNPSPYLFYFDFGEFQIVGSSPEILVRYEDGVVTTRPLAGTRPRGQTPEEDDKLEIELLNDPKELAEHLMLIDLGRNDIGKICATGSVEVTEKMTVERFSHVMHISSNVEGLLRKDRNAFDILRATLPVGTLSGAPKIRAIEIIDELEPSTRGIYGGAVGYISWKGEMDTAIAIRTGIIKDKKLFVQAGCGVVADSQPESEWEETVNKGKAVFQAAELVINNLKLSRQRK